MQLFSATKYQLQKTGFFIGELGVVWMADLAGEEGVF
jgi:hypothetical protein